ncbi:hypothetical protein LMG8286_01418 [Campylobacter suis]|uniref:histidine kinase n=2 Tax=Campylobacter suis TaxID=2790657 RepID=A0ABN7KBG8_9BACT|nr:hypothetical protein LMG8286_01418 [Campylobacter suis]
MIISEEVKNLKEIKMGVYMKATMNSFEDVEIYASQKGVNLCIISENNQTLYQNSTCDLPKESIFLSDDRVGIYENIQNMQGETSELAKARIIILGKDIKSELFALKAKIFGEILAILLAMLAVAFVLTRLALKPLYEKIKTLNNFIKDATHEINTPLSIVLMSTETMDESTLNKRNLNRVNNINLAAKSLHNVYEDLLYLNFKPSMRKSVTIDFKTLLNERIEYFGIFFEKRALNVSKNLQNATIKASEPELIRIVITY